MLTIQDLVSRYEVSRQQIYERLRSSGVSPIKRGNRSLFDEEMVARLDEQHLKLQQGFSLGDTTDDTRQTIDITPVGQTTLEPAPDQGLALFVSALSSALQPTDDNHLTTHRQLEEIAANEWVVSMKVLARCLGMSNGTLHSWDQEEHRFGFRLERLGRGTWRVFRPGR